MKLDKIEEIIKPVIESLGFEIEYIEFVKEGQGNVFRVVIDKPGEKLWVEDCEKVSHAIEDLVDKNIPSEYTLEVSSPGLERQLKNIRLYNKYKGQRIHVKLFKKMDNLKEFEAVIEDVDSNNENVTLALDYGKKITLSLKEIAVAYTTYDFDAVLNGNTDNVNLNKLSKWGN